MGTEKDNRGHCLHMGYDGWKSHSKLGPYGGDFGRDLRINGGV